MSRIAPLHEKVLGVKAAYASLIEELGLDPEPMVVVQSTEPITKEQLQKAAGNLKLIPRGEPEITWRIPPVVMASLIDAATRLAMGTETRDVGIMATTGSPDYQRFYDFVADNDPALVDAWHFGENIRVQREARGEGPEEPE